MEQVEYIQQPLRVIMGKSYLKYKKVATDMMFLNKAVRSMSKRELMAVIGYQYSLLGQGKRQKANDKNKDKI